MLQPRPMIDRISVEPLRVEHLEELASALLHPAVYRHIGGELPSLDDFKLGLSRALAGPPARATGQTWLNYLVRQTGTNAMLGRLEATVHNGLAEVAFLFGPRHWGQGFASAGLLWLHKEVESKCGISQFWATTVPANLECQSLLERCGYMPVTGSTPQLLSYDTGDLVFRHNARK